MEIYYAGIGSRKTPNNVCQKMIEIGYVLAKKGFVLRSGAAEGADAAFELGCDKAKGEKEIYLPWKGFNKHNSSLYKICAKARDIAFQYHPNLYSLSEGAQKLMARNGYQILGENLKTPSAFIVCWTENGEAMGGTGQSYRINAGQKNPVPIFNLYHDDQLDALKKFVKELENDNNI